MDCFSNIIVDDCQDGTKMMITDIYCLMKGERDTKMFKISAKRHSTILIVDLVNDN